MTDTDTDTRPSVRVLCDGGGRERPDDSTVHRTVTPDGVVRREVDGDEQDLLRVPISSTRPDREGDRFSKEALEGMEQQIRAENPMVFDNHGLAGSWMDAIPYDSRETIGTQIDAELESAEDGEWDLYALVNPDGTHEEGERMLRQVRDEGQAIKFSVGFRVLGYDAREEVEADYEGDGRVFTAADEMETSRVGIPANPDASVTQSMTAKGGGGLPGYQNHPMMQMMAAMQGEEPDAAAITKDGVTSETVEDGTPVEVDGQREAATDGGDPSDELTALREEVAELRELVKEDDDDDDDDDEEEEGACDVDTDCPEGEVCLEGECVPEDEVDDDQTSGADVPEHVKEARAERKALRDEISEIRDLVAEGRGKSETGDTTDPAPEETDDADDESDDDKTAMDLARGS